MSFAIKNLRDVEDVAPRFGFDVVQEARFAWRALGAQDTGFAYHVIKPGQRGAAHRHQEAEEIFEADPDGLELLVFGPHHEADGEILKESPWQ